MASVTLQGLYLAPVADLSDLLHLNAGVELSDNLDARVEARAYSAGRIRMIKRVGRDRTLSLAVRRVDRTTRERLDLWAGTLLLLRDGRGRKVYGFYSTPSYAESPGLPYCGVSLTFTQVTYDEAV